MDSRVEKALRRAKSGELSRKELENLRDNARRIGGAEEVVAACEEMLSKLPKARGGGRKRAPDEIAEQRNGYAIMSSAYSEKGELLKPELIQIAEELARNNHVSEVSVLKTQLKLYYKGRHFTAGGNAKGTDFWVAILDETKIADSTIKAWEALGTIKKGTYFKTQYVAVEVSDINELHLALDQVVFT